MGGAPLASPREWAPQLVEVAVPPDKYRDARLVRNGLPLLLYRQELAGRERVLAQWPRSGVGRYQLELKVGGQTIEHLAYSVLPEKIGEEAYRALINDLQGQQLPTSIAISLERSGALAGLDLRPREETTLAQELVRLRRAIEGSKARVGLAAALTALARDPQRMLTKTELWVPAERIRRLEPLGLVRAVRSPGNLDPEVRRPLHVPDARVEHTVDVYENRLVKLYHEQVALRLRRLGTVLETNGQKGGLADTKQLDGTLRLARREASFLDEVTLPRSLPTVLTMVLLRRPEYRSVLESYLEFHREAYVELDDPRLDAPLENLPRLYELWGTLQLIDVILACAHELGYETRQRLVKQVGRGLYVKILPDGEPAVVLVNPDDHRVVKLVPQRRFTRTSRPLHSISFKQGPDVVVEVDWPDQPTSLLLFDPKYKLRSEDGVEGEEDGEPAEAAPGGRPKKIDIDMMHAYRDAIRGAGEKRAVRYAAILYPGPPVRYGDGIEALSAIPSDAEPLRARLREIFLEALA